MKKLATCGLAVVLLLCIWCGPAYGVEHLVPVGQVIGLELADDTVTVASFDQILGGPAKAAGLREGDRIVSIDGRRICNATDVKKALNCSHGRIELVLERKGKQETLQLVPQITKDGPKLGVFLKQGVTGIGTVTWFDPVSGRFGCLGHGVTGRDGQVLQMVSGKIYEADVVSVKQGKAGEPGQLQGALTDGKELGTLQKNTARGLFGETAEGWLGQAMEVAEADQIQTGEASILCTVSDGGVREYSVEICKLYPRTKSGDKNMLLRVTDPELLAITGGIVQGMSGSPIIQNGKLVGAVTHVLVNDPTRGYGIFIENMLDAEK